MFTPQSTPEFTFESPVFFYLGEGEFSHLALCIAEGLLQLEIPFYANINHWQITPDKEEYLFCYRPTVTPNDCSIVVVSKGGLLAAAPGESLFHPERKYITVYLDDWDGLTVWNEVYNFFDLRFKTHYNSKAQYPSNCIPWAFGLSNRILRETSHIPKFQQRRRHLTANFRVDQQLCKFTNCLLKIGSGFIEVNSATLSADRPLRRIARAQFLPLIQKILPLDDLVDDFDTPPSESYHYLKWQQTGQRHYPTYYQRLKKSVACACFGGLITPSYATGEPLVEWWDSWRFWESLGAGCATFHVDFDKYGIQLPLMPENWRHYIGIDLDNINATVDRIADDPEILERISTEGRRWAIDNYGPVATALRFLETLSCHSSLLQNHPAIQRNERTFSLPVQLTQINLIIFPNWSQLENCLSLELEQVLRALANHPDHSKMTLLIDTSNISDEDANLILSSVAMNLLMVEDLDVSNGPEITLLGILSETQRKILLPRLQARIVLENENKEAITQVKAENIPSYKLERFIQETDW